MLVGVMRLFDYYKRICPAYLEDVIKIHRQNHMFIVDHSWSGKCYLRRGEELLADAGDCGLVFRVASQAILGIKPGFDGLIVEPCLPDEIKHYEVERFSEVVSIKLRLKMLAEKVVPR